jgi:hypothetical protein
MTEPTGRSPSTPVCQGRTAVTLIESPIFTVPPEHESGVTDAQVSETPRQP